MERLLSNSIIIDLYIINNMGFIMKKRQAVYFAKRMSKYYQCKYYVMLTPSGIYTYGQIATSNYRVIQVYDKGVKQNE